MRVLIADDDPLSREGLESKLRRWGYETIAVPDGNQAWEVLQGDDPPKLGIIDWGMPGLSGIQICQKVREDNAQGYTYLILLTGRNRTEDVVEGMEAGADDYLTKPTRSEELKARLHAAQRILDLHAQVIEESRAREAEQKRHVEELGEREERLRAILSSLHEAEIIVYGRSGEIVQGWRSPELDDRYGLKMADMMGKSAADFLPADQAEGAIALLREVLETGSPARRELCFTFPNGNFWQDISLAPMTDAAGKVSGAVAFIHDVTERKRMQEELHQSRKLEAVGQLAAGIAHEINTPMQYAGDNTRFLQESFADISTVLDAYSRLLAAAKEETIAPEAIAEVENALKAADVSYVCEEIPRAIQQSLEGVERVTKIVRAMRDFSHPGVEEKAAIDMNKAIESTITISRNEWKYVGEMETDFDADLPPVLCLPGELNQVILNLIINASHAIAAIVGNGSPGKGTITVSTRRDGDWVEIRVSDTGTGIPEEIRAKIFDPFFTTKPVGTGTGQGLAIAHSVIADKHGGTISFETETGKGTAFIIRLPIDPSSARQPDAAARETVNV